MDYFSKLSRRVTSFIFVGVVSIAIISLIAWWVTYEYIHMSLPAGIVAAGLVGAILLFFLSRSVGRYVIEPIQTLSQAILHVTPGEHGAPPPNLEKVRVARELVTNLSLQVYQLASQAGPMPGGQPIAKQTDRAQTILDELPVPIIVCDHSQAIDYANQAAARYLEIPLADIVGKNLYSVIDLSFPTDNTLDAWLQQSQSNTVTSSQHWDRIRLNLPGENGRRQLDMAAYYNKNNPAGAEVVLALFDKTKYYNQDDDAVSFIALAVHELRTPLTILRGYIEVFEDEVYDKVDPEMQDFMKKMEASAQQLSSFVSNILNVARVEEDQLFLQLHAEDWDEVLTGILSDVELRARVNGKKIKADIQPGMPAVAVDRTSMYEVVNNLLDNAIKYSDDSNEILVKSYVRDDGMIETTVQDFGIGIPPNVVGNLFKKFYRNHRSRAQFGGTGLGLFLCKSIVTAHGGQIWVQSKEGEGSTFGFTLQPYAELAKQEGAKDNKDIVRTAHGWIKNHSFYRR